MRLYESIGSHGVATRQELLADGLTRRELVQAEQDGVFRRIDRSRFALPGAHPDVVKAAQCGGTLTCLSALRMHGIATLDDKTLHIRQGRYARRTRRQAGASLCHLPGITASGPVDSIADALRATLRNHDAETAVVALDSVLAGRILTRAELEPIVRHSGDAGARILSRADSRSESALESIVRFRLQSLGIKVQVQVRIPTIGRVDFLVGDCIIIEADGYAYHGVAENPGQFNEDRRRGRRGTVMGKHIIRLTWAQVLHDWDAVVADVLEIVRQDRHRRRS